jgi:hypothetical protein
MKVHRSPRLLVVVPVAVLLMLAVTAPAATAKAPLLMSPQCAPGAAHPAPRALCDRRTTALRARMQSGSSGSSGWIFAVIALGGTGASAVVMMARMRVSRQRSRSALAPIARPRPR